MAGRATYYPRSDYRCKGVPLTYVIREEETPSIDTTLTYDEAGLKAATLDGPDFELDARTVHMLILKILTRIPTRILILSRLRNIVMEGATLKPFGIGTAVTLRNKQLSIRRRPHYKN